jgi:hypothetical protein
MLGNQASTALFAKLYAELLIASQSRPLGGGATSRFISDYPKSLPELVLKYLTSLNRNIREDKLDDAVLHQVAKVIAWESLRTNLLPQKVDVADLVDALEGYGSPRNLIAYLEARLKLLQRVGADSRSVRFSLDPLAEYLAALHIVTTNKADVAKWQRFLRNVTSKRKLGLTIDGFLAALHECCVAYREDDNIPAFVIDETASWSLVPTVNEGSIGTPEGQPVKEGMRQSAAKEIENFDSRELARVLVDVASPTNMPQSQFVEICGGRHRGVIPGADHYDYFNLALDKVGIVICHNSSTGAGALSTMLGIQGVVRGAAFANAEPQQISLAVNRYMIESGLNRDYVTMFYGILNSNGDFDYVNAGHFPPYIFGPSGNVRRIGPTSLALGRTPTAEVNIGSSLLARGDVVLLLSEGAMSGSNSTTGALGDAKFDRLLREQVEQAAGGRVSFVVDGVCRALADTRGREDTTAVAFRFLGLPTPAKTLGGDKTP